MNEKQLRKLVSVVDNASCGTIDAEVTEDRSIVLSGEGWRLEVTEETIESLRMLGETTKEIAFRHR